MDIDEILAQLERLADPAYRDSIDYFAPQDRSLGGRQWTSLGVRAPALRKFEKPLFKDLKTSDDYRRTLAFTDEAFDRRIRELAVFGLEALPKLREYWGKDLLDHVMEWVPTLSDWGMTDVTGGLLGEMLVKGIIVIGDLDHLKDHPSIWGQRLLIVSMVLPLRKGCGDPDAYLERLAYFNGRREPMIVKAVSWALREGTKCYPDKIRGFLSRYQDNLHSSILREVRTKLEKGVKTIRRK